MKLRGSHLVSLAIMAAIGGWMFTGNLIEGGQADPNAETIVEREAKRTTKAFRVRIAELQPSEQLSNLNIRGRTKADAMVSVRAETGGTVQERPIHKGQLVKAGDLLCVIDPGVRGISLDQAKAQLEQADEDYRATTRLVRRGFATKSKLRQLKAALNAAKAALATTQQDIARTEVRATTAGVVQEPLAEIGDNLTPGGICATLMNPDPMLFTGQVSERSIGELTTGMKANVTLITDTVVQGKIRYISPVADPKTRTFTIEIMLPNGKGNIRDGLTATALVPLKPTSAYELDASWLTLADDGTIGVRAVTSNNEVSFHPVNILTQNQKTMWVSGLEPGLKIITLGQNYVSKGVKVVPVTAEEMKMLEEAEKNTKVKSKT
ncbi:MAG: efflux RND transporter periplasmic adaptor subunit [Rhizobiaceae bacterium]